MTDQETAGTIRLAGHELSCLAMLETVARNVRGTNRYGTQRWILVMETFAVGSTVARAICRQFSLDPEEVLKK